MRILGSVIMAGLVFTLWMAGAGRARGALAFAEYTYHVGLETSGVAAADVNGDGSLDLICANYSNNTLTVLTNNGSGVFVTNGTYHVGKGPTYVTAADLRGSGMVDMVCANYGGGGGTTLSILTNNGNDVFGSNATVTVGLGPSCVFALSLGRGTIGFGFRQLGNQWKWPDSVRFNQQWQRNIPSGKHAYGGH